jgi:DnaJ domain
MDPYRVLGVARDATPAEITARYRALLLALHPDTQSEPADPDRLAEVLAAYALLRDTAQPVPAEPVPIEVRVHNERPHHEPDIRVGPVRRHWDHTR